MIFFRLLSPSHSPQCSRVLLTQDSKYKTLIDNKMWLKMLHYQVNAMDLTPNFAGTLMGFNSCLGNISGFLAPYYVGVITNNNVGTKILEGF